MHHDVRTDDSREMNQNVRYIFDLFVWNTVLYVKLTPPVLHSRIHYVLLSPRSHIFDDRSLLMNKMAPLHEY